MRLSVIVPVAVLCLCAAVALAAWRMRPRQEPPAPRTGMGLLRGYTCSRSESKLVLVKGIEDGFSPAGNEPGYLRPELDKARWRSVGAGNYDQSEPDRYFLDALRVPARIRNALFVIGLKPLAAADSANDVVGLGDVSSTLRFGRAIADLAAQPGWKNEGALYYVEVGDVVLDGGGPMDERTLLDFLNADGRPRWMDVLVEDDTSVDFIGLAACMKPPSGLGATLMTDEKQPVSGVVALACNRGPQDWPVCNQYIGDTPCGTELPLACLLPGRRPAPRMLLDAGLGGTWSGGDIGLTAPVAAARFRDIGEADAFCSARFGEGWRTLNAHDGLPNLGVSGRGQPPGGPVRAWVDQVNQPYGTCWRR